MQVPKSSSLRVLPAHLWRRVKKVGSCWIWTGRCGRGGYGTVKHGDHSFLVHRLVWLVLNGPVPHNKVIRHKCDIRQCCNPQHLLLGTHQENMSDMKERRRVSRIEGDEATWAKLSNAQVRKLRRLKSKGKTNRELATEFGISYSYTCRLVKCTKRAHV